MLHIRKLGLIIILLCLCLVLSLTADYWYPQQTRKANTAELDAPENLLHQALTQFSMSSKQQAFGISQTSADPHYNTAEKLLLSPQGPWLHSLKYDATRRELLESFGLENEMEQLTPDRNTSLREHPLVRLSNPTHIKVVDSIASEDQEFLVLSYRDPVSESFVGKTKDQQVLVNYEYKVWLQIKPKLTLYKSVNFWTYNNPGGTIYTAAELYLEAD